MGYHETVLGVEISAMRNDAGIADPPPVLTLSDFAEPHFGDRAIFQHEEPSVGAAGDDGHHLVDAAPRIGAVHMQPSEFPHQKGDRLVASAFMS